MKKLISIIAALAVCITLTACNGSKPKDEFAGLELVNLSENVNRIRYDTLEALEYGSDVIVVGKFIDESVQTADYEYDPNAGRDIFTYIRSFNTLEVTKVISGNVNVGDHLKVGQSYGVIDDRLISFSKLTPMQKGDEWIFFLLYAPDLDDTYWCAGDSDGRYPTKNSSNNEIMPLSDTPELGVYDERDFKHVIYDEIVKKYDI